MAGLFLIFLLSLSLIRCANIVPPSGGPKDTIPPVLVSATPPDSTLHFRGDRIQFTFNEYVQLANNYNDILIFAPRLRRQPIINVKLRTISILLKDTLQPNTTYQINFGNAIQDINEGNAIPDFSYIFSTGSYLDSLQISGTVLDAETGLPDSNVLVMLYRNFKDSVVSREKPLYYTRTDAAGHYLLHNLPADTFKIFALKEDNNSLMYDDVGKEAIAFLNQPVVLHQDTSGLKLYLFREQVPKDTTTQPIVSAEAAAQPGPFTLQMNLDNGRQSLIAPLQLQCSHPIAYVDSNAITLLEDTTLHPVPFRVVLDDSLHRQIRIFADWKEHTPYQLRIADSAIVDTAHHGLKADTLSFETKSLSDYGSVELRLQGLDTAYHQDVLQIVKDQQIVYHTKIQQYTIKIPLFDPGEYQIRILKDDNGNGKWDTGSYYGPHPHQPEKVIAVPGKITVRANWDNTWMVDVPAE
ncbi:MAG: Ig-like domain-containing protein [Thermoflavifilum sp.]|nr:Ig-like domain-containing protein [Thermoflavifilum sp.]